MKPYMIAHRGYSVWEKENTLPAFTAAGAIREFYGIETDVHITNDNHYVLIHDENLLRVSNNKIDLNVEKNPFSLIRQISLPDIDDYDKREDLVIPEMIEYFRICKKYGKIAVLELKQVFTKEQIKEIISIIESIDMVKNTVFISFIIEDLIILRELRNDVTIQWLLCKYETRHIETCKQYNFGLDVHHSTINEQDIKDCHENNIKVNVWTVNEQETANKFASWGVDFITSNGIKETF